MENPNKNKTITAHNQLEVRKRVDEERSTVPLSEMINRVESEPEQIFIYSGIKENSMGAVFGNPKSGKTIFCENLAMCYAAGKKTFLGQPIIAKNRKVLIVSLEEHYSGRTKRNMSQVNILKRHFGDDWIDNLEVVNEKFPQYFSSNEDFEKLKRIITESKPGLVIIDSLGHLHKGHIEDSETAKNTLQKLREIQQETNITLILIHHTHKMYDRPLSIDTMAGSRVVGQELDFMIGINRVSTGVHYIKDVAFRYKQCDSEKALKFIIDANCWINPKEVTTERAIIEDLDGRRDDSKERLVYNYLVEQTESGKTEIETKELQDEFVDSGVMTKPPLFGILGKLSKDGKIKKLKRGLYALAS